MTRRLLQRYGVLGCLLLASAVALGALTGVGTFTFGYAEGLSYFSKDPRSCANCHVMQEYYDSWSRAGHHHVAGCADCHLPQSFPDKYVSKADNGFFHSLVFTLGAPDAIRLKPRNLRILERQCIRCHQSLVDPLLPPTHAGEAPSCVHCHPNVGHGPR
ncbi:MAG: cytochrome c nitrite reductase small subunit [Planctomycetota bacterium]